MRNTARSYALVALAVSVAACGGVRASSLPFELSELRTDDRLIGGWAAESDSATDTAIVTRGDSGTYDIRLVTHSDDLFGRHPVSGHFVAGLGTIGPRTVLSVMANPDEKLPDVYDLFYLPLNLLLVVEVSADVVTMRNLDKDSLNAAIKSGDVRLTLGDDGVLHASTADLRRELARFLARPGILKGAVTWRRLTIAQ